MEYWPWYSQMASGSGRYSGDVMSTKANTNSFHKTTAL